MLRGHHVALGLVVDLDVGHYMLTASLGAHQLAVLDDLHAGVVVALDRGLEGAHKVVEARGVDVGDHGIHHAADLGLVL